MIPDVDWETWEIKGPPIHDVWKNLEDCYDKGLTKNIGVSNCSIMMFIEILAGAKIKPSTNQIECNPYFSQQELVKFSQKFGCSITAYASIGATGLTGNNLLDDPVIKEVAFKHNATPAQICLAWNLKRGIAWISKSVSKDRMKLNFESQKITLDEEDIEKINGLNCNKRNFDPEIWDNSEVGFHHNPYFR